MLLFFVIGQVSVSRAVTYAAGQGSLFRIFDAGALLINTVNFVFFYYYYFFFLFLWCGIDPTTSDLTICFGVNMFHKKMSPFILTWDKALRGLNFVRCFLATKIQNSAQILANIRKGSSKPLILTRKPWLATM